VIAIDWGWAALGAVAGSSMLCHLLCVCRATTSSSYTFAMQPLQGVCSSGGRGSRGRVKAGGPGMAGGRARWAPGAAAVLAVLQPSAPELPGEGSMCLRS